MKQFPTHIVAVYGVVENDNNEVLLVHDRHRSAWTLPGGQVECGETLTDALHREIMEESGIDAAVGRLHCVSSNTSAYPGYNDYWVPTKVMFGFTCSYAGGEPRGSDETTEARWIPKDRVPEYLAASLPQEKWNAYLRFDGQVEYLSYVTKPEFRLDLKQKI